MSKGLPMPWLGKRSVSSALHALLSFLWYAGIVAFVGVAVGILVVGVISPALLPEQIPGKLSIQVPGLEILFSAPAVAPIQRSLFLAALGLVLPLQLLGLAAIYQLRRIFATLVQGQPFSTENARRVRVIGGLVLVGAVAESVFRLLMGIYLMGSVAIPGVELNPRVSVNTGMLFVGVVVLVLAEIFRIGAGLQDEQDLTV